MKRQYWAVLVVSLSILSGGRESLSAPCWGNKMPQRGEFFLGVEVHNLFKRYLADEYGKVRSFQQFFLLSYGIKKWLSIDLKGGGGYIKQRPVTSCEVDYPIGFSGGYGFRIKFYHNPITKTEAVLGFQHISVHPKKIYLTGEKNKAVLDNWQLSFLLSKRILNLTPYCGMKWSRVDYIHWQNEERKRKKSDLTKSVGVVMGVNLPLTEKSWVNLEFHCCEEEALSLAFIFKG